jgi:hypothetical protein
MRACLASSSLRKWRLATAALTPRRRVPDVFFVLADFRAVVFEAATRVVVGLREPLRRADFDAECVPAVVLRAAFVVPRAGPRLRAAAFLLVDFVRAVFAPAPFLLARFRAGADARETFFGALRVVRAVLRVFFEDVLRFVVFMTASGDVRG